MGCFHMACCACLIDSFHRRGTICPICGQACTQLPKQDAVIASILSVVYKLHEVEEPTFASSGLDPNVVFVNFFPSANQAPGNSHENVQQQLVTQGPGPTQQHGDVHQLAQNSEGGATGTTELAVGHSEQSQPVVAGTHPDGDVNMGTS